MSGDWQENGGTKLDEGRRSTVLDTAPLRVHALAEGQFRAVFDASPIGMALIRLEPSPDEGLLLAVNPALCDIFGRSADALLEGFHYALSHPDDLEVGGVEVARTLSGEDGPCNIEKRFLRTDGSVIYAKLAVSLVRDEAGEPLCGLCHVQDETDEWMAQRALQQSEERYRRIVETTADGVWAFDCAGATTFVNAHLAAMLGYTTEQMLGTELNHHLRGGKVPQALVGADPCAIADLEVELARSDGSTFWASLRRAPLRGSAGRCDGTLAAVRDISERKRSEGEVAELLARFEGAFEQAPIGIALIGLDPEKQGEFVRVNPALAAMLHCEPEDLIGRSHYAFTHPDDIEEGRGLGRRLLEGEIRGYEAERRYVLPDGSVSIGRLRVSLVRDAEGVPLYGIAHVEDITHQRQAEQDAEELEQRFHAAFTSALDAVLVADDQGVWVDANPAACKLVGLPKHDMVGRSYGEFSADPRGAAAAWQAFLRQGAMSGEHEILRPDGERRQVEFSATANFTPGRHLSILRDVTERKREETSRELARVERERLESALHQSQKLDTVGQLAGGVAHDFNNLMAVILNCCEFVLDDLGDHSVRNDVAEIRDAAQRAAALTRQLLVFSRREVVQVEQVKLNDLVGGMERMLRRTIAENVELVIRLDDALPHVEADPNQLEHVLLNLAVNARDAMPDGGRLTVETRAVRLDEEYTRLHPDVAPGAYVLLAVCDDGTGMPEEIRQHALEPFFTTKPKGTGTGLGLATTFGIVKQAGGHIEIYSEVGQGTAVKIYLPAENAGQIGADANGAPATGASDERVMVVDDEPGVREMTARILRGRGYHVVCVENRDEAIAALEAHDIDVVLSDVVMPGVAGPQLVADLRRVRPGLRAVFMSGYTGRVGGVPDDASFISKPFTAQALLDVVAAELVAPAS